MIGSSVAEIVRGQNVISVHPATSVRDAVATLSRHGIGAILVVEGGALLGIFAERDAVTRIIAEGRNPDATRVDAVMSRNPRTVGSDCSVVKAVDIMVSGGYRHLPVVDQSGTIGVLSMRDVPLHYRVMYSNWLAMSLPRATGAAVATS
jgi:CBS domain-containing protein